MKLIVQIPAYNEEATIAQVIRDVPRTLPGFDAIEVLVIDDGSIDRTVAEAQAAGADHIVSLGHNRGLAFAFQAGLDACVRRGADLIVNTDGDHQYPGEYIAALVRPILDRQADLVIGDRQVDQVKHFSLQKRMLERFGSLIVRMASGTSVPDAPSGFRAYSREAALRLFVTSDFSYTLDNLIQAGKRGLRVAHVPITTNPTRPSKLHRGSWHFVKRQSATIVRAYATYEPLKTFFYLSLPFVCVAAILFARLFIIFIRNDFALPGNVQSLIVAVMALIVGFLVMIFGLLADRIGESRRLMEEILYRLRRDEAARPDRPPTDQPGT
ncbi:MAG TPA: glycosyltransferase family 2 protein [Anaerolineae bacterium]|nr:glycosyltransferase family 2 protein [Anaerolineae bacterium]